MKNDDIKEVLNAMMDSIGQDNVALYKKLVDEKVHTDISDHEDFFFSLIYPHRQFLEGLIDTKITHNIGAKFILIHSDYVEHHFEKLIEKVEGSACCADKSRFILHGLLRFYVTGKKIEIDLTQEYTYHLPKKIFTTHDEIVAFFEAVRQLYYGDFDKYVLQLGNVMGLEKE